MAERYLIRVEGVNFAATLDDTQDLSTIRGASLALLAMPALVEATLAELPSVSDLRVVTKGASLSAISFSADAVTAQSAREHVVAALRRNGTDGEPFEHLSFTVDVATSDDGSAIEAAQARNRARQFRQWTVNLPRFVSGNRAIDPLDRTRPASETHELHGKRVRLSPSVAARRNFGRRMRQRLYDMHAPEAASRATRAGLTFADDFRALMQDAPKHLPISTSSHLAIVYADGNRFSTIIRAVGAEAFSKTLLPLQQQLLEDVLGWFHAGALGAHAQAFMVKDRDEMRLRLETLLWGGDELAFVMPAWLALPFIENFFEATRDWAIEGHRLTFAVGAVFAHAKVPIRQMRSLARDVADTLKQACDDPRIATGGVLPAAACIEIFESLSVPENGLAAYRQGLFGPEAADATFPRHLALPADGIGALRAQIRSLKAEANDVPIRRSQLYRILAKARVASDGLAGLDADDIADAALKTYGSRVRGQSVGESLRLPRLGGTPPRPLGVELAMLASLWDYADPFAGSLPSMTREAAR